MPLMGTQIVSVAKCLLLRTKCVVLIMPKRPIKHTLDESPATNHTAPPTIQEPYLSFFQPLS